MTPNDLAEILEIVNNEHGWFARFAKHKEDGKFIKYADISFDTRDGSVWRINFRTSNKNKEFNTSQIGDMKKNILDWLNNKSITFQN